jgi:hypothetical protein
MLYFSNMLEKVVQGNSGRFQVLQAGRWLYSKLVVKISSGVGGSESVTISSSGVGGSESVRWRK